VIHEVTYQAMAKQTRADRHARAAGLLSGAAHAATHLERAYRYRASWAGATRSPRTCAAAR
jgi:hypothetical protein